MATLRWTIQGNALVAVSDDNGMRFVVQPIGDGQWVLYRTNTPYPPEVCLDLIEALELADNDGQRDEDPNNLWRDAATPFAENH